MLIKTQTLNSQGPTRRPLLSDRFDGRPKVTTSDRFVQSQISWEPTQIPSQLLDKSQDGRIRISQFRWGFEETGDVDSWKAKNDDASIDLEKVKDVYFAIEPFKPEWAAAHGLFLFEMEDDKAVTGPNGQKDIGLALSVEARRPKGTDYSVFDGMKKSYGVIHQVGSMADQIQKATRKYGDKLVLHRLRLSASEKKELLTKGLSAATQDRLGEWYHTLMNSCYTQQIDLLNDVVRPHQKMPRWGSLLGIPKPATSFPQFAGGTLKSRALLVEEPITILQRDPDMYPDQQDQQSVVAAAVAPLTRSRAWKPAMQIGSATVGAAVGNFLGAGLGMAYAGAVGAGLGAALGYWSGDRAADHIGAYTDVEFHNAQEWYEERYSETRG